MTLWCAHGPCAGQQLGLAVFLLHSSHCLRGSQTFLTPPLRRPWVLPAHAAQVLVVLLVNPMPGSTPQVSERGSIPTLSASSQFLYVSLSLSRLLSRYKVFFC